MIEISRERELMCCEMNQRNVHENVVACGRYGLKRAIGEGGGGGGFKQ